MAKKRPPLPPKDKTFATVNTVLQVLNNIRPQELPARDEYAEADAEYDKLVEEVVSKHPGIRKLAAKVKRLRDANNKEETELKNLIRRTRDVVRMKGITPSVKKWIDRILQIIHKEPVE